MSSRYGIPCLCFAAILAVILVCKNTCIHLHETIKQMLEGSKVEPLGIAKRFSQEKELMDKTGLITYDFK